VPFSDVGFILSLPAPGVYRAWLSRRGAGSWTGELCADGDGFVVGVRETFFAAVSVCRLDATSAATPPPETESPASGTVGIAVGVSIAAVVAIVALVAIGNRIMKRKKAPSDGSSMNRSLVPDADQT
jgi:hypothetical protein